MFRGAILCTTLCLFAATGCKESEPAKVSATPAPTKVTPPQPGNAASAAAPAAALNPEQEAGKRLFLTACANCHGADGTGSMMRQMMPTIGNITLAETHAKYDEAAFAKLISEGRNKMPAFKTVFKPDQITQIIAYARTLKK